MRRRMSLTSASVLMACACGGMARADTLHVPIEYSTIQDAIAAAIAGDLVVVADGIYTGPGNTNIDFLGKAITVRSENGPEQCVIDGQLGVEGQQSARGFWFHNGEGAGSVLDGFWIYNGFGSPGGGGILITNSSSPTIKNCIITDCYGFDFGGAIMIQNGSPTISGCTFAANYTDWYGGGIYFFGFGHHATITDCIFNGNAGLAFGGGILIENNTTAKINSCIFTGNEHAGIDVDNSVGATITNCLVAGNYGGIETNSPVEITNCSIVLNWVFGGVNATGTGQAVVNNSIVWDNVAAFQINLGDTIVNHSIVEGGWTGDGSGNSSADPMLPVGSAGAWTSPAQFDPLTRTTTFTDINAKFTPGALAGLQFNPDLAQTKILHILANTQTTISVLGNFASGLLYPSFAQAGNEAYQVFDARVLAGSPAIDAGNNAAVPAGITTDLDGRPRFIDDQSTPDTGLGTPPIVDIGAYEFQPSVPGDVNGDGLVNINDLLAVIGDWGPCPDSGSCPADFNTDGVVNVVDLLFVIGNWG